MIIIQQTIAQKYASAFLNVYDAHFTNQTVDSLRQLQQFLRNNKIIFAYLSIPSINEDAKQTAVEKITTRFEIPFLTNIVILLLKHKRITLLPLVITQIIKAYQKKHRFALFTIKTSHALQENEKLQIINFIQHSFEKEKILAQFSVYPKLISGLRINGDNMLWERSIKRTLQNIKQSLFQRVGL